MKPGQVVALVGPSGGGKSTCVRLIEHFYEISGGTILLGERDVRTLDPSWFRRHIGLVSQEPVLFASTIRDNIAYGKDTATQEEVKHRGCLSVCTMLRFHYRLKRLQSRQMHMSLFHPLRSVSASNLTVFLSSNLALSFSKNRTLQL